MLSVSFDLALVAAMLIGIVLPGNRKEVDSLNSPTTRPIPGGFNQVGVALRYVKRAPCVAYAQSFHIH